MDDEETILTPNALTFKYENYEINELQRTFNSVVKTMMIADQKSKNINTALLNYSDAYYIEQYAQDETHRAICLSNIGTLMF